MPMAKIDLVGTSADGQCFLEWEDESFSTKRVGPDGKLLQTDVTGDDLGGQRGRVVAAMNWIRLTQSMVQVFDLTEEERVNIMLTLEAEALGLLPPEAFQAPK